MRERIHDRYRNRSKIEKVKRSGRELRPFCRHTRRNPRAPRPIPDHAIAVYDGQHLVDSVVERNGNFLTFDVHDRRASVFTNHRDAMRALPPARSSS
jgi:hypothetical protein